MKKTIFRELTFDEVLPRLVVTYNKGKLVPFTGAGISANNVPGWEGFLRNLCTNSERKFPLKKKKKPFTPQDLIQLSDDLVTQLSRESKDKFIQCVKNSLGYGPGSHPGISPQYCSLASIRWPLILTTNYDTMYFDCLQHFHELIDEKKRPPYPPGVEVFGRSPGDCHSLLATLSSGSKPAYWALQGLFDRTKAYAADPSLENEIVIGYRQYRNATYSNPTFRSVFAEIYRNHSLFFIGSGLSEDYFRGLFGEVLERFGNNPYTHVALFNSSEKHNIDHHFLHTRFNITPVFYTDETGSTPFSGLPLALDKLHDAIKSANEKLCRLSFCKRNFFDLHGEGITSGLEITAASMPAWNKNECYVFSAGYDGSVLFSGKGQKYINVNHEKVGHFEADKFEQTTSSMVRRFKKTNIYAAIARNLDTPGSSHDARDLRKVLDATEQALTECSKEFTIINMMLLSGGQGKTFPAIYSFIQMLRGYKEFISGNATTPLVRIYIVDPSILSYIRTKPLEIEELLNCDDMRLGIEIRDGADIERSQIYLNADKTLEGISDFYSINNSNWDVTVFPKPFKDFLIKPGDKTAIGDLGLIPGTILIYTRKNENLYNL